MSARTDAHLVAIQAIADMLEDLGDLIDGRHPYCHPEADASACPDVGCPGAPPEGLIAAASRAEEALNSALLDLTAAYQQDRR